MKNKKYNRRLVVAVDLDKTIATFDKWDNIYQFGEPLPGAKEFLSELNKFADIVIHTCRCSPTVVSENTAPWLLANLVRDWLDKNNLCYSEIWCSPGKPNADIFIDDKGYRIPENPSPIDYSEAINKVKDIFGVIDE